MMNRMRHFVLVYYREQGQLLLQEDYADVEMAMRRRFELERLPQYADMEIVVLSARSVEVLHETHGRYFYTLPELMRKLRETITAA
jgi:hypothetical protein